MIPRMPRRVSGNIFCARSLRSSNSAADEDYQNKFPRNKMTEVVIFRESLLNAEQRLML